MEIRARSEIRKLKLWPRTWFNFYSRFLRRGNLIWLLLKYSFPGSYTLLKTKRQTNHNSLKNCEWYAQKSSALILVPNSERERDPGFISSIFLSCCLEAWNWFLPPNFQTKTTLVILHSPGEFVKSLIFLSASKQQVWGESLPKTTAQRRFFSPSLEEGSETREKGRSRLDLESSLSELMWPAHCGENAPKFQHRPLSRFTTRIFSEWIWIFSFFARCLA